MERILVLVFLNVLRGFMYRYLCVDNYFKDELVNFYLILVILVRWFIDIVLEDVVNSCFFLNLLFEYLYVIFMFFVEVIVVICIVR